MVYSMTIQQLRYMITIAEKGSMNEAAKSLFISQPSLTNAVKEVEKEMNIIIFNRTNKGISISNEGDEFLGYARQILEQCNLMEERYKKKSSRTQRFSVSTQHYSFAVNAFVDVIREYSDEKYDFVIRETQTYEIIEDVSRLQSEIGILYLSDTNRTVLSKIIQQHHLKFRELFQAKPHVFISNKHPLKEKEIITLEDIEEYPYLSFEQGANNSFYYAEEILSTLDRERNIKVRDRATLFNLLVGLNGYTISTGIIDEELNGPNIISRPLDVEEDIIVGMVTHKERTLSKLAEKYIESLQKYIMI